MNKITEVITKTEKAEGRYVGDLNLLTLAAFNCNLNQVQDFTAYNQEQLTLFDQLLNDFFNTNIPTAYIVGFEYFLGNKITVTSDTLIPRFETEELVINLESRIRRKYSKGSNLTIADVCCGTGVIGISLYLRLEDDYNISLSFVDISSAAMAVTKQNCNEYNIEANYYIGDMITPLIENDKYFDIIVSNPPYIDEDGYVQDTVVEYEPHLALFAKDKGLALYKQLINDIIKVCNENYCFMLEIGESQALILDEYLFKLHGMHFEIIKDMNGFDRNLLLEG